MGERGTEPSVNGAICNARIRRCAKATDRQGRGDHERAASEVGIIVAITSKAVPSGGLHHASPEPVVRSKCFLLTYGPARSCRTAGHA